MPEPTIQERPTWSHVVLTGLAWAAIAVLGVLCTSWVFRSLWPGRTAISLAVFAPVVSILLVLLPVSYLFGRRVKRWPVPMRTVVGLPMALGWLGALMFVDPQMRSTFFSNPTILAFPVGGTGCVFAASVRSSEAHWHGGPSQWHPA